MSESESSTLVSSGEVDDKSYTVDGAIEHIGFGKYQVLVLLYAGLAWAGDAAELMILSFLGPCLECYWGLDKIEQSWLTTVVFIGMMFGAFTWGALADTYGRKTGFLATALFTAIMGIGSALAPSYPILLFFRALVGFGLGGAPVVFALFMEFVPARQRAFYLVIIELFWTAGSVLEAALAWAVLPTLGWRWLLGISSAPLLLLMFLYPLLPESPRFYFTRGERQKATDVLEQMARMNGKSLPEGKLVDLKDEFKPAQINIFSHTFTMIKGMVSVGYLRVSSLLIWIWFASALCYYSIIMLATQVNQGVQCISRYVPGFTDSDYRNLFINSLAELPGLVFLALMVDRLGRRRTCSLQAFLISLSLLPMLFVDDNNVATFLLFIGRCFAMSNFVLIFLYTPEVYPTIFRAFALGLYNSMSRISGMVTPFLVVALYGEGYKDSAVGILIVLSVGSAFFAFLLPIETSGRKLQDVLQDESKNYLLDKEDTNLI